MLAATALILALASDASSAPSTTNNDDSCEIGTAPAATLLLPYFEVETTRRSIDTMFTVINAGERPQIARVTLWSDWSYPVLAFDIRLTGYDVQPISLYDVIAGGALPPACPSSPSSLPPETAAAVQAALNSGVFPGCTSAIGSPASTKRISTVAVGYATIDVVAACGSASPNDPSYITDELLFDNVLTGDYQLLDRTAGGNYAAGNPLVHVRAVPEGGPAGTPLIGRQTNLPHTFYRRFNNGSNHDRRQPLPRTFAARFIQGGSGSLMTDFLIWREGRMGPVTCTNASDHARLATQEVIRFDEHENPNVYFPGVIIGTPAPPFIPLPATSRTSTASATYPAMFSPAGDTAGWIYLNLDSWRRPQDPPRMQNWVVVTMSGPTGSAAGLYATAFDATHLGNGCSGDMGTSTINGGITPLGPAGGVLVCPGQPACTPGRPPYTGTNATP